MTNNNDDDIKRHREDLFLINRFKNVVISKLEKMTSEVENSGNPFVMGEEETKVFTQITGMGLKEGVAAGLCTFLILRRGPIYIGKWVLKRRKQRSVPSFSQDGGYQLSNPNATANPFQNVQNSERFPRPKSLLLRSIWFVTDSMLSLMVGASASFAFTDTTKIRQQITELPLLPGRSLTSDAFCSDIVAEIQRLQKEHNPVFDRLKNPNNKSPAAFYMQGIADFSQNCERRFFLERQLRQERGLAKSEAVIIPNPGVSKDGPRLVPGSEDSIFEEEEEGEFTDTSDLDWVSGFVSDQNESADSWRK